MQRFILFIMITGVMLLGCSERPEARKKAPAVSVQQKEEDQSRIPEKSFKPFYIYKDKGSRDNHFIPSGFMGSVGCIQFNDRWQENCHSGKSCIKIVFDIECAREDQEWGGIYWQNPANNWGSRKGGFNLAGAEKLTFWAKGDVGGEQIEEITVGGITGDYPDSDKALIGPIILSSEWREYTVDLRGKDLSYINGGFAWTTNHDPNPESCTFYLDEIKYE